MLSKNTFAQAILHFVIMLLLFIMIYPFAMALWCSFKTELGFMYTKWYPTIPLRINNYSVVFGSVQRYILNTMFVAVVGITGLLFIASISAYTFARLKFPGKEFLYMVVISLMMVPGVLTLVPNYMIYKSLGLLNTYMVLILPMIVTGPVFGTFLLRAFFSSIPEDIFESARLDGAKEFVVFYRISLPLSMPILGTLTIMQVNGVWNSYLWPMITIQKNELLPISAGLITRFSSQYANNYPLSFTGYMIASVPLLLLFIFANRYYIEGLTTSAIKL